MSYVVSVLGGALAMLGLVLMAMGVV